MKRLFCIILCAVLLSSCSQTTAPETETAAAVTETLTETETELQDSLPEKNYNGTSYVVLSASEQWQDIYMAEELNGELLNDAVYQRNLGIAERFGIDFQYEIVNGYLAGKQIVQDKLMGSIQAGDAVYDLFTASSSYVGTYILNNLLKNMTDLEYLDFKAPWYYHDANDALTIQNTLYCTAGYFGMDTLDYCGIMLFNKEMFLDLGYEEPYSLVKEGKWTYDVMHSLAEGAVQDLNGDGIMDDSDRFGILETGSGTYREGIQFLGYAMGYHITDTINGKPSYIAPSEQVIQITDTLTTLLQDKNGMIYTCALVTAEELIPMFSAGQGLFGLYSLRIVKTPELRDGVNFGILPCPKLNEIQEKYHALSFVEIQAIPLVVKDLEMSQIVLEGLNSGTYLDVYPNYYSTVLQRKLSQDLESGEMLDIIREGAVCDFGMVYLSVLSSELHGFEGIIAAQSFTTWWASNEKALQTKLDTLIEELASLQG